jgi:hypothetical protein
MYPISAITSTGKEDFFAADALKTVKLGVRPFWSRFL